MKFNPSRLAIARKRRMLNKKAFAEKISVNSHTVTLWEKGETEPAPESVEVMVRVLAYPSLFFYGPDIDEPYKDATSFRSQTSMSAAARDAALAAGSIGFLISDWVEKRFDLPLTSVPDLHLYDPEKAARALRQEWSLGEKPISNMIQLLESKGVRVFSLAENTAAVNAYSLWRSGKPYIFLNIFKSAESSRFDAAHELAHLVLHQDGSVKGRQAEDQANRFAASFLMPQADVISYVPRVAHLHKLIPAKARWKVSLAALNYRVHKLGLISDWKYRDFCIEIARNGYNKKEPEEIAREHSVVWEKVLKSLWSESTTHFDIANDLAIPPEEVGGLLFGMLNSAVAAESAQAEPLSIVPDQQDDPPLAFA
jgi:Zn-dependent peptidase ImmA (M78 family)/DNA-binding XRE family transcriptional regulator